MRTAFLRWGLTAISLVLCLTVTGIYAREEEGSSEQPAAQAPGGRERPGGRAAARPRNNVQVLTDPTGLVPLTDMGTRKKHKGLDGGLYGGGKNEPPKAHQSLARRALKRMRPLDAEGKPAPDGKVVLVSVGMSNTTMEFRTFKKLADADRAKAPHVAIVDTAQGGRSAGAWAKSLRASTKRSAAPPKDPSGKTHTVWDEADRRIKSAGFTPQQVQAVWIKVAGSTKLGFPDHLREFQGHLASIAKLAKKRWPNLQVAYYSSRIYAGYATTRLNPEPWSYESAFGVQGVIRQQIKGEAALNADASRGAVKAPVLLWGPYLWADGTKPRKSDGLIWEKKDLATDGTHPSSSGKRKVAEQLLRFFTTDPLSKPWFARSPGKK